MKANTPGRRERKRQQTADHIVETAMALFRERGFDGVTMEEIASGADVARGTLYSYFPVKEAVLSHYFSQQLLLALPGIFASLAEIPDPLQRISAYLDGTAAWLEGHREFFAPYLQYRFANPETEDSGTSRIYLQLLTAAQTAGRLRTDMPVEHQVHYLRFLVLGALNRWLQKSETSLQTEYRLMWAFFLQGAGVNTEDSAS